MKVFSIAAFLLLGTTNLADPMLFDGSDPTKWTIENTPAFILQNDPMPPPRLVVRGPGKYEVTFNYTSVAELKKRAADEHNYTDRAYAVLALEILRLRKCPEPKPDHN